MAPIKRDRAASTHFDPVERFFGESPDWFRWPERIGPVNDFLQADDHRENGTLVVRADLAGLDPRKVTVSDDVLQCKAAAAQRVHQVRAEQGAAIIWSLNPLHVLGVHDHVKGTASCR